jgi:hypothetical protein
MGARREWGQVERRGCGQSSVARTRWRLVRGGRNLSVPRDPVARRLRLSVGRQSSNLALWLVGCRAGMEGRAEIVRVKKSTHRANHLPGSTVGFVVKGPRYRLSSFHVEF